jgi:hypothetical protein
MSQVGTMAGAYLRAMQPSSGESTLAALLAEQRALEDRAHALRSRVEDARAMGVAPAVASTEL